MTVKTNIGEMPVEEYRDIAAIQAGFDSYEDMRKQGFRLGNEYDAEDNCTENTNDLGGMNQCLM